MEESTELTPVALLCRRLAALLIMVSILLVGIVSKLLYTFDRAGLHGAYNGTVFNSTTTFAADLWNVTTEMGTTTAAIG